MKSDLDRLMTERKIDQLVVFGPDGLGAVNAAFNYFVGGRHIVGMVVKQRGQKPLLIHGVMERDDAAQTGLELIENTRWNLKEIQQQFTDPFAARVELNRQMFHDLGITGRVAFYGVAEVGSVTALLRELSKQIPGLIVLAEGYRDVIQQARETKDDEELKLMAEVGRATCEVVAQTRQFLQSHAVNEETLQKNDGTPLTIGDVKRHVRRLLIDQDLEHPGDFIFSQGRDAGVPHNHGNPDDPVRLGKTLIFDIYPRRKGGYFHDMTRTWCLGYAPREVQQAYDDVAHCFQSVVDKLHVGQRTYLLQQLTCDIFESVGRPTIRQDPKRHFGYIHSLGHGLGLDVHELPSCPTFSDAGQQIEHGTIITVEPGLYYPDEGFGIRIEDTYVIDHEGLVRSLTPCSRELVVPM
ncbi:MAG: M24 family metallopeptidase [Planctomycetaceae bacterium]